MKAHTKIATIAGWALYVVSVVVFEGFFLALTGQASEVPQLTLVHNQATFSARDRCS